MIASLALSLMGGIGRAHARPPAAPSLSGRIQYYSAPRPVADVAVQALGPVEHSTMSDAAGAFSFFDLDEADWTIEPTKMGGRDEAISTLDATYVLQAVAGLRAFTPLQRLACDVTGNGSISTLDAAHILQMVAGLRSQFSVADACESDWAFVPMPESAANQTIVPPLMAPGSCQRGAIRFEPLEGMAASQDFLGVVFGDCTGNWLPKSPVGALLQ